MVDIANLKSIDAEVRRLRQDGNEDAILPWLEARLDHCANHEERAYLLHQLAAEYQLHKDYTAAQNALERLVSSCPEDPEPWIRLAEHFHYHSPNIVKARWAANTAIRLATAQGNFVRQAHGVRIRIALDAEDYRAIEESVRVLIDFTPRPDAIDVGLESDFLPRLPRQFVEANLIRLYAERLGSQSSP